jgi:hypothetical protein
VANTADTLTPGTLRQALTDAAANNNPATVDTVTFNAGVTGTISLTAILPRIDEPLTITGPGASALNINAGGNSGIFYVNTASGNDVTISGLTLTGSRRTGTTDNGGAIDSFYADLMVQSAVISGNSITGDQGQGGAIYTYNGSLAITGSTITGNHTEGAMGKGGSVYAFGGRTTIQSSVISNSFTQGGSAAGGGLAFRKDQATVSNSTISGNQATGASGGGVYGGSTGYVHLQNSAVDSNTSAGNGGGIHSLSMPISITASTVSGNSATDNGGGLFGSFAPVTVESATISGNHALAGKGGAIYFDHGSGSISNSTIAGNDASITGGGGIFTRSVPDLPMNNSIVADNTVAGAPNDLGGFLPTDDFIDSFTLVENPAGRSITAGVAGSNLSGVDPMLGPLAANGGPTKTQRPALNSPVVDKGKAAASKVADQRGLLRPFDVPSIANAAAAGADGADMGAVELTLAEATPPVVTPPAGGSSKKKKKCKKKPKRHSAGAAKGCKKKK